MVDYLIYKGSVSIYPETNSKKKIVQRHNAGTLNLSRLFAGICTADPNVVYHKDKPENYIGPYYIDLQTSSGESAVDEAEGWGLGTHHGAKITERNCKLEDAKYKITDIGKEKIKDQNWRAYLQTTIKKSYLNQNISAATRICLLDYNHQLLAEVDFSKMEQYSSTYLTELFDITNNLIVIWELELLIPEEGE